MIVTFRNESHQLLDDLFDQLSERIGRVLVVDVFDQFGDDFRIRFRLECVTLLLQKLLDVLVVGDDTYIELNESK